jgi:hypothetical protein
MHTRGLGTARVTVEAAADLPTGSRTLTGVGAASLDRGTGQLQVTASARGSVEYRRTGKGLFVQDGSTGLWTVYPDPFDVPGGAFTDPLRGLGDLRDTHVRSTGVGIVVTGTTPATAEQLRQIGLSDMDLAALPEGWAMSPVTVTVRIDPSGRIAAVDRDWAAAGIRAASTTVLADFRTPLNLTVPDAASVTSTRVDDASTKATRADDASTKATRTDDASTKATR